MRIFVPKLLALIFLKPILNCMNRLTIVAVSVIFFASCNYYKYVSTGESRSETSSESLLIITTVRDSLKLGLIFFGTNVRTIFQFSFEKQGV